MESVKRADKYWLCFTCAEKNKWIFPEYPVTGIYGLCGHCKRKDESELIPIVDFKKKKTDKILWD